MLILPKQTLLCVGKLPKQHSYIEQGWQHYAKLIKPYVAGLTVVEVPETPASPTMPIAKILSTEAQRLQAPWQAAAYRIALVPQGETYTSPELAQQLNQRLGRLGDVVATQPTGGRGQGQASSIVWLVGGPHGLCSSLVAQAHWQVSLGQLTWPHPLVRLLWLEQLYRSCRLLNGHAYHK
jgi:23S rRNA (pseudouridine1915-N3)-methyltransferase